MDSSTRLFAMVSLGALLLALGCASTTEPSAPASEAPEPGPAANADRSGADLALGGPGAPELSSIHFDTDRALLRDDARETLKRHARAIQQHPEWGVVTIEGHCDERGSEEYNLALGARRAAAVARYLTDLGVSESRLETRTFGEARPAVTGHHEAAWRQNRRAELQSEVRDSAHR